MLSGSWRSTVLLLLAFRGGLFVFGLGDLDLRLVSGLTPVRGDPNDLPLRVRITVSYPVVGGVAGWFATWKP
jgi:hypothetical protein